MWYACVCVCVIESALETLTYAAHADTQKLSKQAIYCLHRGDFKGADSKLKAAMEAADKLKPIVDSEPSLRNGGSFSSAMEEVRTACGHARSLALLTRGLVDDATEIQR